MTAINFEQTNKQIQLTNLVQTHYQLPKQLKTKILKTQTHALLQQKKSKKIPKSTPKKKVFQKKKFLKQQN